MHVHSLTQTDIQALAYVMRGDSATDVPPAVSEARVQFGIDDAMRDELIEATDCAMDFWRVAMQSGDSCDQLTAEAHLEAMSDLRHALSTPTKEGSPTQ